MREDRRSGLEDEEYTKYQVHNHEYECTISGYTRYKQIGQFTTRSLHPRKFTYCLGQPRALRLGAGLKHTCSYPGSDP